MVFCKKGGERSVGERDSKKSSPPVTSVNLHSMGDCPCSARVEESEKLAAVRQFCLVSLARLSQRRAVR